MAAVRFPKPEVVLSQPWIEIYEIWYADGFSPSQTNAVTNTELRSSFRTL